MAIKSIGIVGSGTMGLGIAQVCAINDHPVILFDSDKSKLDNALERIKKNLDKGVEIGKITEMQSAKCLKNIVTTHSLGEIKADMVIEAIFEDLKAKQTLFSEIESINNPDTILATNTSSIPVTQIAACLKNPSRFIGIHFFNPAHIMKLVEIVVGISTDIELVDRVKNWVGSIGKSGVIVKDSPGFIVNRIARPFYTESLKCLEECSSSIGDIDDMMESTGFRMGPFRLMDLIGIDTNFSVTKSIYEQFYGEPRFRPSRIQRKFVDAGLHGKKTGKGFYSYA